MPTNLALLVLVALVAVNVYGIVALIVTRPQREELARLRRIAEQFDGVHKALVAHVPGLYPDPDAMTRESVTDALVAVERALDACEAYFDAQGEFASKRWGEGYEELSRARAKFRAAMAELPRRSKRRAA